MNAKLSSIVSDVDSADKAASHAAWVHAKITKAMADSRPRVPHEEAMDRISAMIDAAEQKFVAGLS
ncbi:MAG: antitoxin [Pseudomonadota bacterium]